MMTTTTTTDTTTATTTDTTTDTTNHTLIDTPSDTLIETRADATDARLTPAVIRAETATQFATKTTTLRSAELLIESSTEPSIEASIEPSNESSIRPQKRVRLDDERLMAMTVNELRHYWKEQELYINWIESQLKQFGRDKCDLISLRESEEKLKQQQLEANRRENILVMRLTTKEQEMQEYLNQIQELKQSQMPTTAQLKNTLVDPAVNFIFEKMKKEVESSRARVEEMQNELKAWKFTPDSNTGKRLMAKCKLLYQENEELGKMIASGRIGKLEGELALQKNFSEEMKKSQAELDEFLLELDEDVEGMQNTIYYLQQQLKEAKEKLAELENCSISELHNECADQTNQTNVVINNIDFTNNVKNASSSSSLSSSSSHQKQHSPQLSANSPSINPINPINERTFKLNELSDGVADGQDVKIDQFSQFYQINQINTDRCDHILLQ